MARRGVAMFSGRLEFHGRRPLVGVLSVALVAGLLQVVAAEPRAAAAKTQPSAVDPMSLPSLTAGTRPAAAFPVADVDRGQVARPAVVVSDTDSHPVVTGFVEGASVVAARDVRSTTWANPDGSNTMVLGDRPVNYQLADGAWRAIDTHLEVDPATPGAFRTKANNWRASFARLDQGVAIETPDGAVSFAPVGARAVAPRVLADGAGVIYEDAWPGVDVRYEVLSDQLKEHVIIKSRSAALAASAFSFTTRTGASAAQLRTAAGLKASGPALAAGTAGVPRLAGTLGNQVGFAPAEVLDAMGTPVPNTGARLRAVGGDRLSVGVDAAWLAGLPASAFPIDLDPTLSVGPVENGAYKQDGYSCSSCGLRVGNSMSSNLMWHSVAHFPYESLLGKNYMVTGASLAVTNTAGTNNGYTAYLYWASAFSYGGAVRYPALATGTVGSSGTLSGTALTSQYNTWVRDGASGGSIGFMGQETLNLYTYKSLSATLTLTYSRPPTMPVPSVPANGASLHQTSVTMAATASDPDGGAVSYLFRAATGSTAETGVVYDSGWTSAASATMPIDADLYNTPIYWHVYAKDSTGLVTNPNWVRKFTPANAAPAAASGPQPTTGKTISAVTPQLGIAVASDPNGDAVQYRFRVFTGQGGAGVVADSDWIGSLNWIVPAGVLHDGMTYRWNVETRVLIAGVAALTTTPPWENTLTVNLRLGAGGPQPVDAAGPVSVNLATGNVMVSTGTPTMNTVGGGIGLSFAYNSLAPSDAGLVGSYYDDADANRSIEAGQEPLLVRTDPNVNFSWSTGAPAPGLPKDNFVVNWSGYLTLPTGMPAGPYLFGTKADNGSKVTVNNVVAFSNWINVIPPSAPQFGATAVTLTPGVAVPITVDYFEGTGGASISLYVKGALGGSAASVAQMIPAPGWFTTRISPLPDGWTLSAPSAGGGAYTGAVVSDATVVLTDASGASHSYAAKPGGGYAPPAGEEGVLARDSSGALTLIDGDGSTYTFDAAGKPITSRARPMT